MVSLFGRCSQFWRWSSWTLWIPNSSSNARFFRFFASRMAIIFGSHILGKLSRIFRFILDLVKVCHNALSMLEVFESFQTCHPQILILSWKSSHICLYSLVTKLNVLGLSTWQCLEKKILMVDNNNNGLFITEKASLVRPPSITKEGYPYWKDKMEMYIKSTH